MKGPIEADPSLPPAEVPGAVLHELSSHARETSPEECCGLLTGDAAERFRRAWRCGNDMNMLHLREPQRYPHDAKHAFHMNPTDYLAVVKAAEAEGESVNGVYHSHVGVGAYFSELDQEYATQEHFPFPRADHFVIAVADGEVKRVVEICVFRWSASAGRFEGRLVQAAVP